MRRLRTIDPLTALACLVAVVVFIKNAWVSEDAYIIFRSLEQLFAGQGPVWNPHERVQVFTSPLWYWLLAVVRACSPDLYLNAVGLGLVMWLACLAVIRRLAATPATFLLMVLALLSANGFSDYTSSGLENSLLYLLLALFVLAFARVLAHGPAPASLSRLWLVAGLVLLTRQDHVFLIMPAVVGVTWRSRVQLDRRACARLLLLGGSPLLAWMVFALVYYGFPFPNTAYAKLNTGLPVVVQLQQGVKYFLAALGWDPLMLIACGGFVWWGRRLAGVRLLVVGVMLQLFYVLWVGGDFMQGRFLSGAYLVAVLAVVNLLPWRPAGLPLAWVAVVLYGALFPHTPLNVPRHYPQPGLDFGVVDERGYYNDDLSLWRYWSSRQSGRVFPDMAWRTEATAFRESSETVMVAGNIGVFGYLVGTEKIIIDQLALADPLLARLPATPESRVGHYVRTVPEQYVESLRTKKTGGLEDAHLQQLAADIVLITRSDQLFSAARWRAILRRNF